MKPSTLRGLIVIGAALIWAMTAWSVARAAGIEFGLKDSASTDTVRSFDVALSVIVAGLVAWGVHSVLHRSGHARWWPVVGSTALAISMIGPSYYADGETAVALMIMHFVVGATLMAGFALATGGSWRCMPGLTQSPHGG